MTLNLTLRAEPIEPAAEDLELEVVLEHPEAWLWESNIIFWLAVQGPQKTIWQFGDGVLMQYWRFIILINTIANHIIAALFQLVQGPPRLLSVPCLALPTMVLTVGKWMHCGSGRGSEWLLTDSDTKRCYFIRRTKTGKLACGAQGTFESADDWLTLTEFACASDSHIKRRTLTFRQISGSDQWVEQGSATRRILWIGWIDLHLMRVFWSPTVHNFSRWQFQLVQGQFVTEVLRWLDPDFEMEERAADGTHDNEWHIVTEV